MRVFRIERESALLNPLDQALLVNHKGRAAGQPDQRHQNSVLARHRFLFIAQDGKFDSQFFRKSFVLCLAVYTNADDLRARLLEFGNISLICL